jgi:small-conductance mechanosensitive channel
MQERLMALLESIARLLDVDSAETMALRVLGAALVLFAAFVVSRAARGYLIRLQAQDASDEQTIRSYRRVVQVVVWVIASAVAVHTLGIDLTHLFTAGGLFAVALAFAMKNLAENLVSGLLLRLERVVKRGDVLRMASGEIVQVKQIGSRTTVVRTKEEADRIIPNAELVQEAISNYTYQDSLHRIETQVGVSYDSDLRKLKTTLETVCAGLDWKSAKKQPLVQLLDFADSAVIFRVLVWIEDPWISGRLRSELNEVIWWALKDVGIVIAFPQLDVHIASGKATVCQNTGDLQ